MDRSKHRNAALDPNRDPARWEALVGGIVQRATPELARRRDSATLSSAVLHWARPALSAAATIAVLLSVSLAVARSSAAVGNDASLAGALVPEELAAWLMEGYQPTVTEVVAALEEVVR